MGEWMSYNCIYVLAAVLQLCKIIVYIPLVTVIWKLLVILQCYCLWTGMCDTTFALVLSYFHCRSMTSYSNMLKCSLLQLVMHPMEDDWYSIMGLPIVLFLNVESSLCVTHIDCTLHFSLLWQSENNGTVSVLQMLNMQLCQPSISRNRQYSFALRIRSLALECLAMLVNS